MDKFISISNNVFEDQSFEFSKDCVQNFLINHKILPEKTIFINDPIIDTNDFITNQYINTTDFGTNISCKYNEDINYNIIENNEISISL